jgi:hypothetical protein
MNLLFSWNAGIAKIRRTSLVDTLMPSRSASRGGAPVDHLPQDLLLDAQPLQLVALLLP